MDQLELPAGPIPLVPQIVVQPFIDECSLHADELNCLYAHKALKILENLIADRAIRAYGIAIELNCPQIASDVLEKYENGVYSCQLFSQLRKQRNTSTKRSDA